MVAAHAATPLQPAVCAANRGVSCSSPASLINRVFLSACRFLRGTVLSCSGGCWSPSRNTICDIAVPVVSMSGCKMDSRTCHNHGEDPEEKTASNGSDD